MPSKSTGVAVALTCGDNFDLQVQSNFADASAAQQAASLIEERFALAKTRLAEQQKASPKFANLYILGESILDDTTTVQSGTPRD